MNYAVIAVASLIVLGFSFTSVYAHTTIQVGPYEIEAGWLDEPPVVGILNAITIDIREPGDVEGVSTGITYAKIIPTKIGSLQLELKGEVNGVEIDVVIPIEDVESTSVLDFPQTSGSSSGQEVAALKNAITSLHKDVSSMKTQVGGINTDSGDFDTETAYNFGVFGVSLGAAGVILAIIAMVKRK